MIQKREGEEGLVSLFFFVLSSSSLARLCRGRRRRLPLPRRRPLLPQMPGLQGGEHQAGPHGDRLEGGRRGGLGGGSCLGFFEGERVEVEVFLRERRGFLLSSSSPSSFRFVPHAFRQHSPSPERRLLLAPCSWAVAAARDEKSARMREEEKEKREERDSIDVFFFLFDYIFRFIFFLFKKKNQQRTTPTLSSSLSPPRLSPSGQTQTLSLSLNPEIKKSRSIRQKPWSCSTPAAAAAAGCPPHL